MFLTLKSELEAVRQRGGSGRHNPTRKCKEIKARKGVDKGDFTFLERKEMILTHGSKQLEREEDFKRKAASPTSKSPLAALHLSYWMVCCWMDCYPSQALLPNVTIILDAQQPLRSWKSG